MAIVTGNDDTLNEALEELWNKHQTNNKMLLQELEVTQDDFKSITNPINSDWGWQATLVLINKLVWEWYERQYDMERVVFTIKRFGFIRFDVRVKHLKDILTFVFGRTK